MNIPKTLVLILISSCIFFKLTYSQDWTQVTTTGSITARSNASAIYDEANNRMIVIGGMTHGGFTNEIWSLDLNSFAWTPIPSNSTTAPAPRYTHVCMFDSLYNRILMWSGNGAMLYNDVWAFNLHDSTWQELFPDGNVSGAPLKRYGVASVFDPLNRSLISFAGFTTSGRFDDTWTFNVDSQVWTDHTQSTFPLLRCLTSQSFARDRREMIVYGGQSTGNLDDIWTMNTDTYDWTNLSPTIKPSARHFSSNVYCGNGSVVVFGGNSLNQGNTNGALNDLWTFNLDSQTWDSLPQNNIKPSARYGHTSIYIPAQDKMIIFGGQGITSMNAETWIYDGISSYLNDIDESENNFTSLKCFPNPNEGKFNLHFSIQEKSSTNIQIFDCKGRYILTILDDNLPAGKKMISCDALHLSTGIYICVITTNGYRQAIRISLMKDEQ